MEISINFNMISVTNDPINIIDIIGKFLQSGD